MAAKKHTTRSASANFSKTVNDMTTKLARMPFRTVSARSSKTVNDKITKPSRMPLSAVTANPSKSANTETPQRARKASNKSPPTHRILTRSRSKQFQFSNLPPELRNRIYEYALQESEPISFTALRVPPLLHTNQQVRSEALGLPTSLNTVQINARFNYCFQGRHVTGFRHEFFKESGIMPTNAVRKDWMQQHDAVFKGVDIDVGCSCCKNPITIAGISIRFVKGEFVVEPELKDMPALERYAHFQEAWERMVRTMRCELGEMEQREKFVGLAYGDLQKVVGCLRVSMVKEVVVLDD